MEEAGAEAVVRVEYSIVPPTLLARILQHTLCQELAEVREVAARAALLAVEEVVVEMN